MKTKCMTCSPGSAYEPVHLYAGEEAVAVGVCAHLHDGDSITSTHRGHGHCISKGCDLDGMMAEIFESDRIVQRQGRFYAHCGS